MSRADFILMSVAAYVAVMALVRLMKSRRDRLVADVQKQIDARRHTNAPKKLKTAKPPSKSSLPPRIIPRLRFSFP